jgi:hypothetical protein
MQLMRRISRCAAFCVDSCASGVHARITRFCPAHVRAHQDDVKRPSIFGYFV